MAAIPLPFPHAEIVAAHRPVEDNARLTEGDEMRKRSISLLYDDARRHGNRCINGKYRPASVPNAGAAGTALHNQRQRLLHTPMDRSSSSGPSSLTDDTGEDEVEQFSMHTDGPPRSPQPVANGFKSPVSPQPPIALRAPNFYCHAMNAIRASASPLACGGALPLAHHVRDGLCIIFANEQIEVGETFRACPGVANAAQRLRQTFLQDFNFTVLVHWNKTGCQMLDLAREARLDLEFKDGLFVFVLGAIERGWITGSDGIGFPLQDLIQMFGLSSEALPMVFVAHHFPLPASVDPELLNDSPPPGREAWSGREFISLLENQAFLWLAAPASLDDLLRLLRANAAGKDLALIMNQFAEWTRRAGCVRALRMKRTFTKLVYLTTSTVGRDH